MLLVNKQITSFCHIATMSQPSSNAVETIVLDVEELGGVSNVKIWLLGNCAMSIVRLFVPQSLLCFLLSNLYKSATINIFRSLSV